MTLTPAQGTPVSLVPLIRDISDMLARADWSIGRRPGPPRYLTLHYNGPHVRNRTPKGEVEQLIFDAKHHMRPGALNSARGGDGLQYHYAVTSDGTIYQCRAEEDVLWHSANKVGNTWSLSIHLPLGGQQDATEEQWASTVTLFRWLATRYAIPVQRVLGHKEWSTTECPGQNLMRRLNRWRNEAPATPVSLQLEAVADIGIYEGPGLNFPIALDSTAVMKKGDLLAADAVLVGQRYNGDVRWFHRLDGVGFVPWPSVRRI